MTLEEIVRAYFDAWNRLAVDDVVAYFTVDAAWINGHLGRFSGHDEIRKAVEGYVRDATYANHEILNLAIVENVVLTERVDHWVIAGRKIDLPVMGAFEIAGNKISAWRDYFHLSE